LAMTSNNGVAIFENFPTNWELTALGEVCKRGGGFVQTGPFGSQLHASDYVENGVPTVMPVNISENKILIDGIARISEENAEKLSRHRLAPGDIVFSRRGDVTRRALIREEQRGWLCGTGCLKIHLGKDIVDPLFASLYFGHPDVKDWIIRHAVGSTMPNLNGKIMESIPFLLPPLPEQRAIARILGALDDRIELNRRMNHTLEEMARALFKSWFVDFDPVTAKAEGRVPFGMNVETASLFSAEFEETSNEDFPEIPKGWNLQNLDDIADYENGLALQKFPPEGDDFLPVIKIRELRQGFADESSNRASPNIKASCILDDGDVVFSWSGSLMIDLWCGGKGALNQHLFKVTSEKYPKWFYYYWTEYHLPDFQDIAEGKATTMGHIQRHHLTSAKVVVPSDDVLVRANKAIAPLLDSIIKNRVQNKTLITIRDSLLPKLMSGEVSVRNGALGGVA